MFIKSINNFRTSIKREKPDTKNNRFIDEHFVGTYNADQIKGFFGMYHGIKDRPDKYLRSTAVNVAADEQAIYEFMQNAVDCKSTHFFIFYNESYFVAINNGFPFGYKDVKAILNLGQSDKGDAEIGSYGVGFKLAHRLIGKDDGVDELIKEYKGPIIFSWHKIQEFEAFLKNDISVAEFKFDSPDDYKFASWLFKICLTNFPTHPGESVKDLNYEDRVLFSFDELNEVIDFVNENLEMHSNNFNSNAFGQGSLFFLRLGEGKKQYIDNNYSEIERGIEYSLNTLSALHKVCINDQIIEQKKLAIIDYQIPKDSSEFRDISPKNKERDIKIKFGYDYRYWENNHFINAPNFYDYFPMESERHNFRFMLHCNAFDKMVNRRELQKGNINSNLLTAILSRLISDFDAFREEDPKKFLSIYASLLLSEHSKTQWIESELYTPLLNYLKQNIPTTNGYTANQDSVRIKDTSINISPSEIGCSEINWFHWQEKFNQEGFDYNKDVIDQAISKDKLALKKWDIIDLLIYAIDHGKVEEVNAWVKKVNEAHFIDQEKKDWTYINFLKEVDDRITESNFRKISQIKLIKFSDSDYHSFDEVFADPNLIFITEKISSIKFILNNLGLTTSLLDISRNPNLNEIVSSKISDLKLFNVIAEKTKSNSLKPIQKKQLFESLKDFSGVDIKRLGNLELFSASNKVIRPLNRMIKASLQVPSWLTPYKVNMSEYSSYLDEYLVHEESIYSEIIYEEWDKIVNTVPHSKKSITDFYASVLAFFEDDQSSLLLDDKKCIFDGNEFQHHDNVFFHEYFSGVSDYESLRSGILALTGFTAPDMSALDFLTGKPFNIANDLLKDFIKDADFSREEAISLVDFALSVGTNLFEYGYFQEAVDGLISFVHDKKTLQFHSTDQQVIEFIEDNLPDQMKLLPSPLNQFKIKVLHGSDLQEMIISKLGEELQNHVPVLIDFLTGSSLHSLYKEVSGFRIQVKEKYQKQDFEYKLFANLPEDLIEDFNTRLIICDGERKFNATDAASIESFKIEGITLSLSKILPNNPLNENAGVISSVINALNKTGIPKVILTSVFNIDKEPDDDWMKDKLEVLLASENYLLSNPDQLAFVFLYNKVHAEPDLSKVSIIRADDKVDTLNYPWYSQKISFIEDCATFAVEYFGINQILKLSDTNPFYHVNKESKVLFRPYFDSDSAVFVCDYIKSKLNDNENIDLFNFIYNFWSVSQANKLTIRGIDWATINETEIEKIIGFKPSLSIWDNNLTLESEQCPQWLKGWADVPEKQLFLADIGINMYDSPVSELRKSFVSSDLFPEKSIPNNDSLYNALLENTLEWIKTSEIEIVDESRFNLLKAIANEIDIEFDEAFDFESLESSVEWGADYYTRWKEETDCSISIFLYERGMPVLVSYEDYIIWRKSEGDYAYDAENDALYLNGTIARIENILEDVVEKDGSFFNQEHLNQIYKAKNNSDNLIAADEVARIRKENEALKQKLNELSSNQAVDDGRYVQKGGLSLDEQKAISLEARKMVKQKLEQYEEFDCSEWDPAEDTAIVLQKIKKNGKPIDVVIVSAKSSPVHLSPHAFNVLARDPDNQLFVRDYSGIHNVTFQDIFFENQSVNMVFDTNYVPGSVLAQLAHVFNYVTNTKFVIENPHFSANSMLAGFGLDNKNVGDAYIPSDDNEW